MHLFEKMEDQTAKPPAEPEICMEIFNYKQINKRIGLPAIKNSSLIFFQLNLKNNFLRKTKGKPTVTHI